MTTADKPRTLAEKVWDRHLVRKGEGDEPDLLYIDLHLVHEVTSPQAFDGLRLAGRPVRRPDLTIATEDHNVPTLDVLAPIADEVSRVQVETLRRNCAEFGVRLHPMNDPEQGIVHVVGPQLGLTQPGTTVVCGDSHTSTHGAFGAMAFGIGTSEVEHVLATQTLPLAVPHDGDRGDQLRRHAASGRHLQGRHPRGDREDRHRRWPGPRAGVPGQRHREPLDGGPDDDLQHVDRGRCPCGHDRPRRDDLRLPEGPRARPVGDDWDAAVADWRTLRTDDGAEFDRVVHIDADELTPFVTWGTNPGRACRWASPCRTRRPSPTTASAPRWRRRCPTWA